MNSEVYWFDEEEVVHSRKRSRKTTRRDKLENKQGKVIKEKFIDNVVCNSAPSKGIDFSPRGANQRKLLTYLREGRILVWAKGTAGTGKSMVAVSHAADKLRNKQIDKVFLVRPNVHCGKSIGLLRGSLEDKLAPFFAQTVAHFEKFLGKGYTNYALAKKVIEMCAVEYLRGMSFENCIVIVEESQGLTEQEFEMLTTRVGENCQMVFTGDEKQSDIKGRNGLTETLAMLDKARKDRPYYLDSEDMQELYKNIGVVEFTFEDVQRSSMVKALTKLYYHQ